MRRLKRLLARLNSWEESKVMSSIGIVALAQQAQTFVQKWNFFLATIRGAKPMPYITMWVVSQVFTNVTARVKAWLRWLSIPLRGNEESMHACPHNL